LHPADGPKKSIRKETLRRRDNIPPPVRKAKGTMIKKRLFELEEFTRSESVLLYASFRSEVDTIQIIDEALKIGKKVSLPKSDPETHTLSLHLIQGLEDLSEGYKGIPEPAGSAPRVGNNDVQMVIIPGVAFDIRGGRLGYGKGFYDRLLRQLKGNIPLVALAYEEQMTDEIPREEHDVPVDAIITDKRVIRCDG
jgi:5-formyltetrahydrofolate cyclo-ligase